MQNARLDGDARLDAVIRSISDGVAVCNQEGILELFNKAAEEILGIGLTEEDHQKWSSIYGLYLSDGETPCPTESLPLVRALQGETTENFELIIKNYATQKPVIISVTGTPIFDEHGNNDGAVAIFKDITERKQAEEQLEKHKEELAHLMRLDLMNEMAAGMAHELNQPLSAIVNYSAGLARLADVSPVITDEMRNVMDAMIQEATRASGIIRGLRRLVAKRTPNKVRFSVAELIDKSIQICSIEASRQKVEVTCEAMENDPMLFADQVQIEQVVVCLILNSIEALKTSLAKPKRIQLAVISPPDAGYVQLKVTDNGPGIPPELFDKVFQPYYSTKSEGMGMGLAISRSIVESHGGRIWVESDSSGQTGFHISLPVASDD